MQKGCPAPTPWRRMLASPAVWAIITNNFAFHYAFYVIMNWLPTYFNRGCRSGVLTTIQSRLCMMRSGPYHGWGSGLLGTQQVGLAPVSPAKSKLIVAARRGLTPRLTLQALVQQRRTTGQAVERHSFAVAAALQCFEGGPCEPWGTEDVTLLGH
eukprot:scaffold106789_cov17-Tisochrysis_lutea.AAC.1